MATADDIREIFVGCFFGPPCTENDLRRAELALSAPLPPALRSLYAAFDGFRGPTNAGFFWPLFGRDGLVDRNLIYRDEPFPIEWTSQCIFFGDYGCGAMWGIKWDLPNSVIAWDPEFGTDFDVVGCSPFETWRAEKQRYDALAEEGSD